MNLWRQLAIGNETYEFASLTSAMEGDANALDRLPIVRKLLLENVLRHLDGQNVTLDHVRAL